MREKIIKIIKFFAGLFLLLLLWQLLVFVFKTPEYLLPTPLEILKSLIRSRALLWQEAWPTVLETLLGLLVGVSLGFCFALLMSISSVFKMTFWPLILISQAIPTIALAPLFIIWLDYGLSSKIATAAVALFFPVASILLDALDQTPKAYLDLAQSVGASRWAIWWHLRLPAALPAFASGVKMSAVWAPMAAVVGEWVGSSQGLGYLMLQANAKLDLPLMFASLIVLIIFALLLYFLVHGCVKIFLPWQSEILKR